MFGMEKPRLKKERVVGSFVRTGKRQNGVRTSSRQVAQPSTWKAAMRGHLASVASILLTLGQRQQHLINIEWTGGRV